jgi:lipoate-protein ligase A
MARDAALLEHAARTHESVFSIYSWDCPTLSFGRNQRAIGKYDRTRLSAEGVAVVRRPTGGRAILHNREITYSVAAPVVESESLRGAYDRINEMLLSGLGRLGVAASIAADGAAALPPGASPCFETPSEGEIVAGGRKLVGSAQWREPLAFLQHGSILVDDDQSGISAFAAAGAEDAAVTPPAPATLRDLLGRAPSPDEVALAMFEAVREGEGSEGSPMLEDEVRAGALSRLGEFLDDNWTWRR